MRTDRDPSSARWAVESCVESPAVALETTLLAHGLPRDVSRAFAQELNNIVREAGANPALIGVLRGRPVVGLTDEELAHFLGDPPPIKTNTANLGLAIHRGQTAATTVATTMELAAAAGVRHFATGGIGGVHRGYGEHWDISADLAAFTRFPVAVVTSGVKSILDVEATREALETLGVPVVGYRCDRFPAFYVRESPATVDARFDDLKELAGFIEMELARTGRGIVVCNPIPEADAISASEFEGWLAAAEKEIGGTQRLGREATPAILAALHEVSKGRSLAANLSLVLSNTRLAAKLAACG